jgi:hypothetical protein
MGLEQKTRALFGTCETHGGRDTCLGGLAAITKVRRHAQALRQIGWE